MVYKPEFIDNRDGNTLADAIKRHLDELAATYIEPIELSIASGYFNPAGFALIADSLEKLPKVRLMLGAEPYVPPKTVKRKPGEKPVDAWWAEQLKKALKDNENGLVNDRDLIPFSQEDESCVKRLLSWLKSGRVEVRRYTKKFLHGKAFIFSTDEGVIAGSSNFTAAGLTSNLELNLGRYDPTPVAQVKNWFDALWEEAEPYDLVELYKARFAEYPPYLIYLRFLWERYGSELIEEAQTEDRIRLTEFQKDGVWRAEKILSRYNGVIVADGVGLGKTFIGGEIIRKRIEEQRQKVLLISPASLRDGTWSRFEARHLPYQIEKVSYEQFMNDRQLGGTESYLKSNIREYSLVVIDEGHAFRNPSTDRAIALRKFLQGTPPKQVVFMSATPVNNSLLDLYYMIMYFAGHDAAFASDGLVSLREKFNEAMKIDPHELNPNILFDLLDICTVRRTRKFVKRYYPMSQIEGPDGVMMPIRFPEPELKTIKYNFEDILPDLFDRLESALAPPEDEEPEVTMARYTPDWYKLEEQENLVPQLALAGIIRSGLLKRFESSIYAFRCTLHHLIDAHYAFIKTLEKGYVATAELLSEYDPETWDSEEFEELIKEYYTEPANLFNTSKLKSDVENDLEIFKELSEMADKIKEEDDPKLAELVEYLVNIVNNAKVDARNDDEFRDCRKVVIFSTFEDTVDWIETYIRKIVDEDERLAVYKGRIVSSSGQTSRRGISKEEALFGFAPISTEAPPGMSEDKYDILITTDVLAEGQNLQQARNVINYDLPWNPMKLVQRHGRLDRIGSQHPKVFIGCYFPEARLEEMLELEERIRKKVAQAAASVGIESEVIPGSKTSEVVFSETREEIERLRRQDASLLKNAGEEADVLSGEAFRQELKKAMSEWKDRIKSLPTAAGSGFRGAQKSGATFCARVGDRVYYRFVSFEEGEVEKDTLKCLSNIACQPDTKNDVQEDIREKLYGLWVKARDDIYNEWMFLTDPRNLQMKVQPTFEKAIENLRNYPPNGIPQKKIDQTIDCLQAPWQTRIRNSLAELLRREDISQEELSKLIIELVDSLGLRPLEPPKPLAPIAKDEIDLICWMVTMK